MADDRAGRRLYRVSSQLLARKGSAEPLSKPGNPFTLVNEGEDVETDETHLTDAVIDATLDLLVDQPPRIRAPRGAASLTDLLDPTLVEAVRRKPPNSDT